MRPNFGRFRFKRGRIKKKIVSLLSSSLILGKCPRNNVNFPLTKTKIVFFKAQIPSKREDYWGPNLFPQRPNFCFGLTEKFLKELATLTAWFIFSLIFSSETDDRSLEEKLNLFWCCRLFIGPASPPLPSHLLHHPEARRWGLLINK